jgi:uncharacterized protein
MARSIHASIACNLHLPTLQAVLPLLEAEKVEGIEWSFDALFRVPNIPDWFVELLRAYGHAGRLVGHGVYYSLFSGKWKPEQQQWLSHLQKMANNFQFDHISEHFGFVTGEDFHKGAPLGVPFTQRTLAIGRDRLLRMHDACQCPVGLENLAIAYALDDVQRHGDFLDQLVAPINGFVILDLHNLYCQMHNFDIAFEDIIGAYPLHRVREIHISGGSWEDSGIEPGKTMRRDTHNDRVPEAVFDMLEKATALCPNLKFVVLEQLGEFMSTPEQQAGFRSDFERMRSIVQRVANDLPENTVQENFLPKNKITVGTPIQDEGLYAEQMELTSLLENAASASALIADMGQSSLAQSEWQVEQWQPAMLETAMRIAQKWKEGFK